MTNDFNKKYLVFMHPPYEACGGMDDLIGSCNSIEEALSLIKEEGNHQYWQIVEHKTMKTVYDDRTIKLSKWKDIYKNIKWEEYKSTIDLIEQPEEVDYTIIYPNLTTTQKNAYKAFVSEKVYDTTLKQLQYYNGSTWEEMWEQKPTK